VVIGLFEIVMSLVTRKEPELETISGSPVV
jgi:hypothetical protein